MEEYFYKIMTKDNKKWECLGACSFISGIDLSFNSPFLVSLVQFFCRNIFSYSLLHEPVLYFSFQTNNISYVLNSNCASKSNCRRFVPFLSGQDFFVMQKAESQWRPRATGRNAVCPRFMVLGEYWIPFAFRSSFYVVCDLQKPLLNLCTYQVYFYLFHTYVYTY